MTPASRARRNFSRGAVSYDRAASFQNSVAGAIVASLKSSGYGAGRLDILELGCGTGLLTGRILDLLPDSGILACDLSTDMLEVCEAKFMSDIASGRLRLMEHDFDKPIPVDIGLFDLVVSSLALQWASDLKASLRMACAALKPQGALMLSVPLAGSLAELSAAFERQGVRFPGLPLPDEAVLREALSGRFEQVSIERRHFEDGRLSLHECLRRHRALGTVNPGRHVPVGDLRRLLKAAGGDLIAMDYEVAFVKAEMATPMNFIKENPHIA